MPLLKEDKKALAQQYVSAIDAATNTVVLSYKGIPVNKLNAVRMDIAQAQGKLQAVKKRVLAKGVESTGGELSLEGIDDSLMVLYSHNEEDQHAPLKVINKHSKVWKKEKKTFDFNYVGGRYGDVWRSADYVKELADLPSKEELIGKLAFLLNYPIASFARGLQAIADKDGSSEGATPVGETASEEPLTEKEETPAEDAGEESSPEEESATE